VKPGDNVLEIGTGSGYAAAVTSMIAGKVHTVERHQALGQAARERFRELGLDNIEVQIADGTNGWREAAPFDAIIVSAGGPEVPPALKDQLAIRGRLVIPVGDRLGHQTLVKVTRCGVANFEEEHLAAVSFVPLIGEQGWAEDICRSARPV